MARRRLWIARADRFACYAIHARRGAAQLHAWSLNGYGRILRSVRRSDYSDFDRLRRQLCWAHLLRDLQSIMSSPPVTFDAEVWSTDSVSLAPRAYEEARSEPAIDRR